MGSSKVVIVDEPRKVAMKKSSALHRPSIGKKIGLIGSICTWHTRPRKQIPEKKKQTYAMLPHEERHMTISRASTDGEEISDKNQESSLSRLGYQISINI